MLLIFFCVFSALAQDKYEREHRIKKTQFPEKALNYIAENLEDAKRIRFYRETDSSKTSYEVKFKKDRLHYSVEFDKGGKLEDIEILIKAIDIPEESFSRMNDYLEENFSKYRIRRMQQQYPVNPEEDVETTIKNAFQNLMLPSIKYEFIISGKKDEEYEQFEILFDARGKFERIRKSLPPNYDHVLY